MIKFSIVTAVFNRVSTIEEAVKSVAEQDYKHIEHIIQDGGSTDGTLQKLQEIVGANTSVQSQQDRGIYDAINKGIQRSSGSVIGLMHSDDFFANNRVISRVARAFQDPTIDGVYGDLDYISDKNREKIVRKWRSGSYNIEKLKNGWMPPHPTLYLRRNIFEKWGYYDINLKISSDYDAILRFLIKGNVKLEYIDDVLVKMRVGGESNASIKKIVTKTREDYFAIRRNDLGGLKTLLLKNTSKMKQFF